MPESAPVGAGRPTVPVTPHGADRPGIRMTTTVAPTGDSGDAAQAAS